MPEVSRVIYNRLDVPNDSDTNGLLQIDASVNYGLDQKLGVVAHRGAEGDRHAVQHLHPPGPPTDAHRGAR